MPSQIPSQDMALVLFLLVLFVIKHFLADFVFQTEYMLRKGDQTGWQRPLAVHCAVQAGLTFLITFPPIGLWAVALALIDFVIHYCVDYWKAQIARYPLNSREFWISFGADQLLHSLTYIALAYIAVHFA